MYLTFLPSCLYTNLCDCLGILWLVVVDENASTTGYEDHEQRCNDVDIGHGVLQVSKALTVEVEQKGHHAQSQQRGAGSHQNAEERHRDVS